MKELNKKIKNCYKNDLYKNLVRIPKHKYMISTLVCLLLFFMFLLTSFFYKENLSNWYQKLFIDKSIVIVEYVPNNISKITYRKRTDNEKEIVNFVIEKSDIDKLIETLYNVKFNEEKQQNQKFNDSDYKLRIEVKGNNLLTLDFYETSNNEVFIKLNNNDTSKVYQIDNEYYQNILTIADVKYYLHITKNSLPSENDCLYAKKIALEGLSESETLYVQKKVREAHSLMECLLLDGVQTVKDANSPYWKSYTVDEPFIDPYSGVTVDATGFFDIINEVNELQKNIENKETKEICNEFCNKLQDAMNNHDLASCFEAHKILHDIDYWVINYPPQYETEMPGPVDWSGINCYFGLLEQYANME